MKPIEAHISRKGHLWQGGFWQEGFRLIAMTVVCLLGLSVSACNPFASKEAEEDSHDTPSKKPIPRWEIIKAPQTNARTAPSRDAPIAFRYKVSGLPVQVISETKEFRLVCDPYGNRVWISASLLRGSSRVMNRTESRLPMLAKPKDGANLRSYLAVNALATVEKCEKGWCQIKVKREGGWVPESKLWGRQSEAVCQRTDPLKEPIAPLRPAK